MAGERWRVFLDTNVFIAGLVSRTGASAAILDLGEAGEIRILISRHVLVEADRVFSKKFPQLTDQFRLFIKNLAPLLIDDPAPAAVMAAGKVIEPGDAPILAAVKAEPADYLVTLNTRHFITSQVRAYVSTPIVTPAEFCTAFRAFWERAG
ncbi:MAG: putative toxin-antitoxin system toxin component, PIN family [Candidatus Omnitrophica bacterium]|nr:putative toxin-antitoxin system toxin component, PIN family [Candidatus Omnitrophota bacterium]